MNSEKVIIGGQALVDLVYKAATDKKAENLETIDVRGIPAPADYFVVASTDNSVHLRAIFEGIISGLKEHKVSPWQTEGDGESTWLLIDYGDVIVHVMDAESRKRYDLTSLWKERLAAGSGERE
jgi:ribosome-associated protein